MQTQPKCPAMSFFLAVLAPVSLFQVLASSCTSLRLLKKLFILLCYCFAILCYAYFVSPWFSIEV